MKIKLIAVGTKMPSWVNEGYQEFAKRLGNDMRLELIEIPAGKRAKNADIARLMTKESELMLAQVRSQDYVIAFDVGGKRHSTESMAKQWLQLQQQGQDVCLLVGGPEGLTDTARQRADTRWSLSDLTLPHPLVRIMIAEQVYRCSSLNKGHPYHK